MVSAATQRLYALAQADFKAWCDAEHLNGRSIEDIARYLNFCLINYGPTTVPQRVAAIGKLHRDQGHPFDTKTPAIQAVLQRARKIIRERRELPAGDPQASQSN
jgi:hypothetical protein